MSLSKLIVTRILKDGEVTLTQLENRAIERGLLLDDLYTALEAVHRNKSIARTVRQGEVVYMKKAPPKSPTDHLAYIRNNYPPMTPDNDGSGIDVGDLSWMFLKTKEERDAFKAEMSGRPVYTKNTWQKKVR
jgi:hypothetical protein